MSPSRSVLGIGAGLAGAAVAAAAGVAADRLWRARRTAISLGVAGDYVEVPDEERVVIAEDGVPLHVEIDEPEGHESRPTVILSHGYTHNLTVWVFQRRMLRAAGYRVVLWDVRGHGRSEEAEDSTYTVRQLGRDLGAVIAQTTPTGPIVLVGHSMGGMTMMSFASAYPDVLRERVIGAAFISSSAGDLASVNYGLGRQLGTIVHRLGPAAMLRLSDQEALVTSTRHAGKDLEGYLVHRWSFASPVPMSIVRLVADMIFATKMSTTSAYLSSLMLHDERDALREFIGIETLVMHGDHDRITPDAHSEAIVDAIPGAEYVLVRNAGHVLPLEYPEIVDEHLIDMIDRACRALAGQARPKKRPRRVVQRVPAPGRPGPATKARGNPAS
ncbi:alpha/beta fold hydrolase [Allobranchiibius huperziae]|uniref:Pimeloyl-ACP methyl ester carboxylesterase n=1 Tax=Allobranchiibius huperziae TaxID=1874116 RepID=A0A853DHT1_9MICO|nr:pimeloyl-ACP methyl ester carboxylesterase [Allobranchiibius huperziae]